MIDSLGAGTLESLFGWMSNSISSNTKTEFKNAAKALALGAACVAILKTLSYLTNAKPCSCYDWTALDDDDSDSCCSHINNQESSTPPSNEPSANVNAIADKVTQIVTSTISEPEIEEKAEPTVESITTSVDEEEKSWLDRFEEAECATGTNPWSVPPTSSFEVFNES